MKKKLTKITRKTFNSFFAIDDQVDFRVGDDESYRGTIVAVRFTEAKVFYDIVDDYNAKVRRNIDSCDIIYRT